MKAEDIRDRNSLEAWLIARPEGVRSSEAVAIAQRAALRAFPMWSGDLEEEWAQEAEMTALPILRLHLTAGVTRRFPTQKFKAADDAFGVNAVTRSNYPHSNFAGRAASTVAEATDASNFPSSMRFPGSGAKVAVAVVRAVDAAAHASRAFDRIDYADFWRSIRADATEVEVGSDLAMLPLWSVAPINAFSKYDAKARAIWARDPETWSFWTRWWDGVLSGNQLDWELQKQVALIPDAIWEQGPKAVAQAIREIEERFDLRQQVSALRGKLEALTTALAQQASAHHRSHNNPPELIDAPAQIMVQVNTLVATLRETELELPKPAPDNSLLSKFAERLRDGALAVMRYCGGLVTTIVAEAAKSVGKRAGDALVAYVALEPMMKGITSLAEAILTHLGKFP